MEKRTQKQRSYTYFLMKKVSKLLSEVKPTLDKVYYTLQPNETPIINYKNLLKNGNENI